MANENRIAPAANIFGSKAYSLRNLLLYARYVISGCTAAATDLVLLYLFTDILGIWYLTSSIIAYIMTLLVGFMLQKFWTFQDRRTRGWIQRQFLLYSSFNVCALGINTLGMHLLVERFGILYLHSQIILGISLMVFSFAFNRLIVFTLDTSWSPYAISRSGKDQTNAESDTISSKSHS